MSAHNRPPIVLTVAGSDPSAGAGLQADLRTVNALGGYALTAVTAITVQDSGHVHRVEALKAQLVAQQMSTVLADMPVGCIKLGMLATREIVEAVAGVLSAWPDLPVVADPVLAGTGGGTLLEGRGIDSYKKNLLPRITLLTPNLPEAGAFTDRPVTSTADMERAARQLAACGCAVLVTGGHLAATTLTDLLYWENGVETFTASRLAGSGFHGTGCTLASAIATGLAAGEDLLTAVGRGRRFVRQAMERSLSLGKGQNILYMGPPSRENR